jgi:pyruvate kinase
MQTLSLDLSRVALKQRRTKIVATVGPASSSPAMLQRLIEAGVNVFRLNFSHGTHEMHGEVYGRIRTAAAHANRQVAILADLCGPKIRVGQFEGGGIDLRIGESVTVTVRETQGRPGLIPSQYHALASDVRHGDRILLDDGQLELRVEAVAGTEITCTVVVGGRLRDKKGMNLPGVAVSAPALTDKDREDATFASQLGVDYLALSFVRSPGDVQQLRDLLAHLGRDTPIIAKIEKPEALTVIGAILEAADGIMVARGDLGVECPAEEVPLIQQELVRLAIQANKPVIVATQMLESMISNPRPTRAEMSDVAHAAMSRADAVMLSAETAAGQYPVDAVATMDRVLRLVEGYQWQHGAFGTVTPGAPAGLGDDSGEALSRATALLSRELGVRAVVVPTRTGRTARLVSAERPAAPILAVTHNEDVCRRLALQWGIQPMLARLEDLETPSLLGRRVAVEAGMAEAGQLILLVWETRAEGRSAPTVSIVSV